METFLENVQLLAQGNTELHDSVHHFAQMLMAGSPETVGVDKAIQAEPMVIEKKVQTACRKYADVLSQTVKVEEKEDVKRGTGTTDDEGMIVATVPKPRNL